MNPTNHSIPGWGAFGPSPKLPTPVQDTSLDKNTTKEVNTMRLPTPFELEINEFIALLERSNIRTSLVITEEDRNGYRLGFVDYALERCGIPNAQYALVSVESKNADELAWLFTAMTTLKPAFAVASPEKDSILFVDIPSDKRDDIGNDFGAIFEVAGFRFEYEAKFEKRGTSLLRPAALFWHFNRQLNILEMSPEDFMSKSDIELLREAGALDDAGRALDGLIVGRVSTLTAMVNHTRHNYWVATKGMLERQLRRFNHPVHNFRAITPEGMVKGQIIYISDKQFNRLYGRDVDIVQMSGEIKGAIKHLDSSFILSDPQLGHHRLNFNAQSLSNRRLDAAEPNWVFDQLVEHVENRCEKALDPIEGPEFLFGDLDQLLADIAYHNREGGNISDMQRLQNRGTDMYVRGIPVRSIPDVMTSALNFKRTHLPNSDPAKGKWGKRIKLPAGKSGAHIQVVSYAAAKMAGYTGPYVEQGTIRYWKRANFAIVNTVEYVVSFYDNSGGCDHDDFFDLVEVKAVNGQRKLVVWRNPSTMREYSLFTIEGHWPITEAASFEVTPKVKSLHEAETDGDAIRANIDWMYALYALMAPHAISGMAKTGFLNKSLIGCDAVAYKGLPEGVKLHNGGRYTFNQFVIMANDRFNGEGSVDQAVNTCMVLETSYGPIRGMRLCPMEDKVDTYVQGGSSEARAAVAQENSLLFEASCRRALRGEAFDQRFAQMRSVPGVYYSTFQKPLPKQAMRKFSGKLDEHIEVDNRNWYGHFIARTERYLDQKTAYAKKVVSDTAFSFAHPCVKQMGRKYYGLDGRRLYTDTGQFVAAKSKGQPLPVDLTYGASGLLRRFRMEQARIGEARRADIAALPKDASEADREAITDASMRLMEATAEAMFFDRHNWDPNYCVSDEMLGTYGFGNVKAHIRAARQGGLSTLDLTNGDTEQLYQFVLALAAACYLTPLKDGTLSFYIFRSDHMWWLLMEALAYYSEGEYYSMDEIIAEAEVRED